MRKILPIFVLASLLLTGAGCILFPAATLKPVAIDYWRADDSESAVADVIAAYTKLHPNVAISVRSIRGEDYEKELVTALAEDRGPDIFSIPNTWIRGWQERLLPMPKETNIPTRTVNKNKQVVVVTQKTPSLTARRLISDYVETVSGDVILRVEPATDKDKAEDRIFGLPFSVDTLGLFYNRELLKKANIEKPPDNWGDFLDQVSRLAIREDATVKQAGAAIGLSQNIRNAPETLLTLMMQFGAPMADKQGPNFSADIQDNRYQRPPATEALLFIQRFARPGDDAYTWNADMPEALDAFVSGKTAFYFGYPSEFLTIRARAPKLDVGVAAMPQEIPDKPANIAYYPVEVVSKKTKSPDVAWDFIQFAASLDQVRPFLAATNRPTALRSLINEQQATPEVGPFVRQLLTARNWYFGKNYLKTCGIIGALIEVRPNYALDQSHEASIANAENEIYQTWR